MTSPSLMYGFVSVVSSGSLMMSGKGAAAALNKCDGATAQKPCGYGEAEGLGHRVAPRPGPEARKELPSEGRLSQ